MELDNIRTLGILGDRDTAKTNLAFKFLKEYKGKRDIVLYGYPKKTQYRHINTLQELNLTTNSIVFMDELQRHIRFYQKRTSEDFLELLSTMAHNNNTIIFTTPMSQYITKSLDCFLDGFCYTRIEDLGSLKNGAKAKRRLQEFSCPRISKWSLILKNGEYLQIIDGANDNGLKKFANQKIGKDWRI